jgi:hypothetical protein
MKRGWIDPPPEEAATIRAKIIEQLQMIGYAIDENGLRLTVSLDDKDALRKVQAHYVEYLRNKAKPWLAPLERMLVDAFIADGKTLDPNNIKPHIIRVKPRTVEHVVYEWACLHWSIAISHGMGRRMRFIVIDETNGKLMGLISLADSRMGMSVLDKWIGWNKQHRAERGHAVIVCPVLGAVPPYSRLLGGKLIAMLSVSTEITRTWMLRYGGTTSQTGRTIPGDIAAITTMSALGRSSIYNRLRYRERLLFEKIGVTTGHGVFHLVSELYPTLKRFVKKYDPRFRNRKKLRIRQGNRMYILASALRLCGLPKSVLQHGIAREFYVALLAANAKEYLRCEVDELQYYSYPLDDLFAYWRERWMVPRIEWDTSYKDFSPDEYMLWPDSAQQQMLLFGGCAVLSHSDLQGLQWSKESQEKE